MGQSSFVFLVHLDLFQSVAVFRNEFWNKLILNEEKRRKGTNDLTHF